MATRPSTIRSRPPVSLALLVALLGACGYAAAAGGATSLPQETWLQAGIALLGVVAAVAWLGPGALRPGASPWALAGLALLVLFAAWTGASLAWSVAPDRTWTEVNRVLSYALVVALALAAAATAPRPAERVAAGWLVIATAIAVYALAGAVAPGVVDDARGIARLRAPLGYWNALGLVCVLAVAPAIRFATAREHGAAVRVGALVALVLLLTCLGLTLSRGGVLALVVAVVVLVAAGGPRLASLAVLGLGAVGAGPALALGWTDERLSANTRPLADQIDAGILLGAVLAAGVLVAALLALGALRLERRIAWTRRRSRTVWLALGLVALAALVGGLAAVALSERGLRGSVAAAADAFTDAERRDPTYEPGRLLSAGSANRWAWWQEAGGAWAEEPVTGWGAGSFATTRRLFRATPGDVRQPHSTPMQFLAETGVVGALLGLGALALLFAGAVARVRSAPREGRSREHDLQAALLAGAAAWAAHSLVDWDWDIPGVTLPALLFLGVLGARRAAPREPVLAGAAEPRIGRIAALAAACLLALGVLASAVLPALADARADRAYEGVGERSDEALADAAADAALAARLDPLSVRPLFAAAAVAEGRGRLLEARAHLLDAADRQPWNVDVWTRLTAIAIRLADREGGQRAAARAMALDPGDRATAAFARRAHGLLAPPQASPTATGTPLPGGPATPPR